MFVCGNCAADGRGQWRSTVITKLLSILMPERGVYSEAGSPEEAKPDIRDSAGDLEAFLP